MLLRTSAFILFMQVKNLLKLLVQYYKNTCLLCCKITGTYSLFIYLFNFYFYYFLGDAGEWRPVRPGLSDQLPLWPVAGTCGEGSPTLHGHLAPSHPTQASQERRPCSVIVTWSVFCLFWRPCSVIFIFTWSVFCLFMETLLSHIHIYLKCFLSFYVDPVQSYLPQVFFSLFMVFSVYFRVDLSCFKMYLKRPYILFKKKLSCNISLRYAFKIIFCKVFFIPHVWFPPL